MARKIKFLGTIITGNLSLSHHIAYVQNKAFKRLNILKGISGKSQGACSKYLISIVNALIRSLFDFNCFLYVGLSKTDINKIETIYNSVLRFATGLPRWTPLPLLRRAANQPSLFTRIKDRSI